MSVTPEALLEQALRELGVSPKELLAKARRARRELGDYIRKFYYETEEGKAIREALSLAAIESGYADELRNWWTEEKREELRRLAKAANIGGLYRWIWGKERTRR